MPSILVEAAFLSNSSEVKLLRKRSVLGEIADSIANGVIDFLGSTSPRIAEAAPPVKYLKHTVKKGETLWAIARRYGLTTDTLRALNHLESNCKIFPGQKLTVYREK
jgi:N-acetylmuramoyl-L-alanine amidase